MQATESTVQQKGIAITDNVIGIDTTKYSASSESKQTLYLDVLPQENIRYTLETKESKIDIYYTFTNGKLQKIHVLEAKGNLQMKKALQSNSLEKTKEFLSSYQNYCKNPFYGELRSMLENVDANKNLTTTYGNTKLSVTLQDNSATFRWIYTFNGIDAPDKCVALHYEDDFLSYFIDNWEIYKIGNTNFNFSEQEAIDIAIKQASSFTWAVKSGNKTFADLKYNVTNAMVWKTVFANSLFTDNPRGQDKLMLYPMRHIWVSFDKFYPGYIYGMNVYVWADTGEICHSQERFSPMSPPADLMISEEYIASLVAAQQTSKFESSQSDRDNVIRLSALTVTMIGTVLVCSRNKKLRSSKLGVMFLCILIVSTTLLFVASASTASALPQYGRATIWGSESEGARIDPNGTSWRKPYEEVIQQRNTSAYLAYLFSQNGYSASDSQGTKGFTSYKDNILSRTGFDQQNYARIAVVDFDHGNGLQPVPIEGVPSDEFHYMFEDQFGTLSGDWLNPEPTGEEAVFDFEIYQQNNLKRHYFVLINACNSAHINSTFGDTNPVNSTQGMINGRARGMPYAWSHGTKVLDYGDSTPDPGWMSGDGYQYPDNNQFCYIGFLKGSASLTQDITGEDGNPHPYWYWLERFFENALMCDMSIKQALNEASQEYYHDNFGSIALSEGFNAIWPMFYIDKPEDQGPPHYAEPYWHYEPVPASIGSKMKLYGNSNLELYQPLLTLSANNGLSPTFTLTSSQCGSRYYTNGGHRLISDTYDVTVTDMPGYTFRDFTYKVGSTTTTYSGRPATMQIALDSVLTANYIQNPNHYPTVPALSGPSSGYRAESQQFSAVSTDPDGNTIHYEFNWGDGTTTTTGYLASGVTATATHAWTSNGTFQVTVRAQDSAGSGWTYPSPSISFSSNEASPSIPTVTGPSPPTYVNTNYLFSAVSTDRNGDTIRYRFQWGDGTPDTYTGYYASGQTAYASHTWTSTGTFNVYVSAVDSTGRTNYPRKVTVNIQSPSVSYDVAFDIYMGDQPGTMGFKIDGQTGYVSGNSYNLQAGTHTVEFYNQFYQWYFQYAGYLYHGYPYWPLPSSFQIFVDEPGQYIVAFYTL